MTARARPATPGPWATAGANAPKKATNSEVTSIRGNRGRMIIVAGSPTRETMWKLKATTGRVARMAARLTAAGVTSH